MGSQDYVNFLDYINFIRLYPNPYFWGVLLYFLVPLLLWIGCTLFIRRGEARTSRAFAFIAGSDNRLSLSRLQAFLWTLVIFGSFVAAMAIHTKISPLTEADKITAKDNARLTVDLREGYKTVYDLALVKFKENPDTPDVKASLQKAGADYHKAAEEANAAAIKDQFSDWVNIPAALLALAGIAIGSGIFSSIISAVNSEDKSAEVDYIAHLPAEKFNNDANFPNVPFDSQSDRLLLISGEDFGQESKVRFAKGRFTTTYAPVLFWSDTQIVVEVPQGNYDTIVIDTPNGKLCYYYQAAAKKGDDPKLGTSRFFYEFSDLFRDDKNPRNMDLMKFQMFGWTVVAIVIYSWLFLYDLSDHIMSLPIVPQAIVILTGLSQAGYLAGKGVSNIPKNEEKDKSKK